MTGSAERRLLPCLLLCAGTLFASLLPAHAQETDGSALILDLADSTLIARAWGALYPDSIAPEGEYQVLVPSGPMLSSGREASAAVFLLRDGTEAGRLDRSTWDALAAAPAREGEPGWAASMEGPDKQDVPLLWHAFKWDRETVMQWAEWPSEFAVGIGSSISAIRSSKPQYQRDIDFAWNQKAFGHFLLGAQLHRSQFGGGLSRLGRSVADTAGGRLPRGVPQEFWSDAYWWWALSAGVPGLRYTLSQADRPLPDFYWLDPAPVRAIRNHASGRVVNQWQGATLERSGNFAHTLDARFGVLRYGFHWDADAYRVPIQTAGLDDLPALFGTWGGGLILASDILATRLWLDIPDLTLKLGLPEAFPSRFRVAFLHFDMAYRNPGSFSLGISVRVRVDNPIMNRPGA
ncbi:MAG TPA: hypothetical protein VJ385_15380 [Fibrobacteria bacterium]|nr:hypothetical protein [Fibrobacteria bacterium]